jgi:hypothetical protein
LKLDNLFQTLFHIICSSFDVISFILFENDLGHKVTKEGPKALPLLNLAHAQVFSFDYFDS